MKSFLQGKRHHAAAPLCAPAPARLNAGSSLSAVVATSAAPRVEVIKQGDKIIRLIITCSCGEHTEIECLYPPGQ